MGDSFIVLGKDEVLVSGERGGSLVVQVKDEEVSSGYPCSSKRECNEFADGPQVRQILGVCGRPANFVTFARVSQL